MEKELQFFEDFVSKYDMNDDKIKLKYNHTHRVVKIAKEIAESLNLDEKETNRACVCALFHDIARFPQIESYDTFNDSKSFDHGDRGAEILKENNYNDDIVLKAVKYHNKKEIPKFDELTDMHCKLVRDADKIDIMGIWLHTNDNSNFVDEDTINCFKNHTQTNNLPSYTGVTHTLRNLGFIFDINYKRSIELIIERKLLENRLDYLKDRISETQYNLIEKELKEYIKERFDIIC